MEFIMAKSATMVVKMLSTADTGFFYVKKRNPRKQPEKMEMRKYDPIVRKHVSFKETKIK
jgi:large subunit ribosomal protein L33